MRTSFGTPALLPIAFFFFGCASSPAAPFDTFKSAPMTAFRLQNYEPPAAAPAAQAPALGLPPEIQQWITAGASMLPPGLLPPGLLPGAPAAAAAPPIDNVQRFHGFRILGQAQVVDEKLRSELINIFGFEKNFDSTHGNCLYAEFGFSFARINQPPADILVSMSCDQVQAQNFFWPYKDTGLTPDTVQRLSKLTQATFGFGG